MHNKSKNRTLFFILTWLIAKPVPSYAWHDYAYYGDWNYYGSGRDHPYSSYIDRDNYIGYAQYAPIEPDYIDSSDLILSRPGTAVTPIPAIPAAQPVEFTVNIPNSQGGYNSVVIKTSGHGYVGPLGEYYPEFPKIFQLEMKYGK